MTANSGDADAIALAQKISNNLVDLAHSVRQDPTEARGMIASAEAAVADLRSLYALVGEP